MQPSAKTASVSAKYSVATSHCLSYKIEAISINNFIYIIVMNTILLTGSTGFLGKFILEKLTTKFPQSSIYCLVRPKKNATAK